MRPYGAADEKGVVMGCNCGGRSARATTSAGTATVWRHTDPYGGQVDYWDPARAQAALKARGGTVQEVDPRTGTPVQPKK
jgi:hypothetical protein